VGQYERLILLAEDQLTEYSSDARKIEKLRQKFGLSVSRREQEEIGIAANQPLDYLATAGGLAGAIVLQKWGWQLQAKRLVLQTLQDIKQRVDNPQGQK
jgi:hypothetical protein